MEIICNQISCLKLFKINFIKTCIQIRIIFYRIFKPTLNIKTLICNINHSNAKFLVNLVKMSKMANIIKRVNQISYIKTLQIYNNLFLAVIKLEIDLLDFNFLTV